jgi:hypothetical protein
MTWQRRASYPEFAMDMSCKGLRTVGGCLESMGHPILMKHFENQSGSSTGGKFFAKSHNCHNCDHKLPEDEYTSSLGHGRSKLKYRNLLGTIYFMMKHLTPDCLKGEDI